MQCASVLLVVQVPWCAAEAEKVSTQKKRKEFCVNFYGGFYLTWSNAKVKRIMLLSNIAYFYTTFACRYFPTQGVVLGSCRMGSQFVEKLAPIVNELIFTTCQRKTGAGCFFWISYPHDANKKLGDLDVFHIPTWTYVESYKSSVPSYRSLW